MASRDDLANAKFTDDYPTRDSADTFSRIQEPQNS
jgi:hypothetical protein